MAAVDQQKIRRTRTGLIAHDPARAQPGYTLFAPMYGDGTVYLIDMDGEAVHTWRLPYRPGLYGYLLDNGHLLYGGKVMDDLGRFEAWPRVKGGAVLEVDWSGRVGSGIRTTTTMPADFETATSSCCVRVPYPPSSSAASRAGCTAPRSAAPCMATTSSK